MDFTLKNCTTPVDYDLRDRVSKYWIREDREKFLYFSMVQAYEMLERLHVRLPDTVDELRDIVIFAYEAAWILSAAADHFGSFSLVDSAQWAIVDLVRARRARPL
jgi:hypothetical protein